MPDPTNQPPSKNDAAGMVFGGLTQEQYDQLKAEEEKELAVFGDGAVRRGVKPMSKADPTIDPATLKPLPKCPHCGEPMAASPYHYGCANNHTAMVIDRTQYLEACIAELRADAHEVVALRAFVIELRTALAARDGEVERLRVIMAAARCVVEQTNAFTCRENGLTTYSVEQASLAGLAAALAAAEAALAAKKGTPQ